MKWQRCLPRRKDDDHMSLKIMGENTLQALISTVIGKFAAIKSIRSVEQSTASTADGGTNVITIAFSDGSTKDIAVKNGSRGSTGPAGAAGPQGPAGATGAAGTNGTSASWFTGTAVTGTDNSAETVFGSKSGDMYLNTSTGNVYRASGVNSWSYVCNIKGAVGATGPKGDTGATGATGAQGPKGDTGATGPQGAKGATGATGPQGPKGDTGATGATGPRGATGPQGPKITISYASETLTLS